MTPNLKVIDISHYNTVTSFAEIKASGILGVILKATQGSGLVDVTFSSRLQQARSAGLLVGAYHFGTADDVTKQVEHFLTTAKPTPDILLALDYEDYPYSQMSLVQAKEFLDLASSEAGRDLTLYSGNTVKEALGNQIDEDLGQYRLWLAEYGPQPIPQASWKTAWLWQFSDGQHGPSHATIPGISGFVDLNSFAGTDDELRSQWAG